VESETRSNDIPSAILQQLDSELVQFDADLHTIEENHSESRINETEITAVKTEINSAFDAYLDELAETLTPTGSEAARSAISEIDAVDSPAPLQNGLTRDQENDKPTVRLEDIFATAPYGHRPRVKQLGLAGLVSIILASYGTYWLSSNPSSPIESSNANVEDQESVPQTNVSEINGHASVSAPETSSTETRGPNRELAQPISTTNASMESNQPVNETLNMTAKEKAILPASPTKIVTTIEKIHDVKKGETLWQLTGQYLHDPYQYPAVAEDNSIANPDLIHPNDRIRFTAKDDK
jgi:nucleoid-associated protein YgaU